MPEPRQSTVYDYSDLRVHPDGSRVYQKPSNRKAKLAQVAFQDARANWIARDAGGIVTVPKYRPKSRNLPDDHNDEANEGETFEEPELVEGEAGSGDGKQSDGDEVSSVGKKRRPKRFDGRKAKRQKFLKSEDYLTTSSIPGLEKVPQSPVQDSFFQEPSPDLLKCIHRFASEFYTERGQLLNVSREYRKEKKQRARIRRQKATEGPGHAASQSSSSSSSSTSGTSDSESDILSEDDESDEDGLACATSAGVNGKGKSKQQKVGRKGRQNEKLYTDMYKVFDGSAILALGMLVQEHVAHLLESATSDVWREEVQNDYIDPWGESCGSPFQENSNTADHSDGDEEQGSHNGVIKADGSDGTAVPVVDDPLHTKLSRSPTAYLQPSKGPPSKEKDISEEDGMSDDVSEEEALPSDDSDRKDSDSG